MWVVMGLESSKYYIRVEALRLGYGVDQAEELVDEEYEDDEVKG